MSLRTARICPVCRKPFVVTNVEPLTLRSETYCPSHRPTVQHVCVTA